jgi:MoaA/NifB/PqqE/SkfB family radical SAM enzyme
MATGLDSLNISLDAANAPVHDAIRGVEGSWETAVQAARDVVSLKGRSGMPRLKIVMVVGSDNVEEVPGMVDVAADLGVECLEYIPEQPFSGKKITGYTEENCLAQRAAELLNKAVNSARGRVRIENSPRMLELFAPALGGKPSPLKCFAAYNTITIDCYGQVFPCLPWANWEKSPQGLINNDLKELWQSTAYGKTRQEAVLCRQCTLNCQAELNLLFQPLKRVKRR